jgi:pectinesterase
VAIIVHGGGWTGGDKRQDVDGLFEPLAAADVTWFSINYRLAPAHRWPACLADVRTAIDWVRAHAGDYRGDPDRIALIGYSAGGHLVCQAAVQADTPPAVRAVIGLAAPTDLEADSQRRGGLSSCLQALFDLPAALTPPSRVRLRDASALFQVRASLPPFLLIHGTRDTSVPYDQSVRFQEALQARQVRCDLISLDGAGHRIADWPAVDAAVFQTLAAWLVRTLTPPAEPVTAPPPAAAAPVTITVAPDGSGEFTSVQAAIDAVADHSEQPTEIRIKPGVYKEKIVVPRSKRFVRLVGDNALRTVLTWDLNARMPGADGREIGTFRTPSVTFEADDCSAEGITFENSAGPVGQALAVALFGDRLVFRRCRFLGWQDTVLDHKGRHYYEQCYIAGHCDFIFGGGTAFFERCRIHCLQKGYITAASTAADQPYGYVFSNCRITGAGPEVTTYLGRPWRDHAKVIFLNTAMASVVRPEGWHNWDHPERETTAYYAEYRSTGPGANPSARVGWSHQLTAAEAQRLTVQAVLSGDDGWNPAGTP